MPARNIYRIIAGKQNHYQKDFLHDTRAGIDFPQNGFTPQMTRREIQILLEMDEPHARAGQVNSLVGQTDTFMNGLQVGDLLIMYHAASDRFIPGVIESDVRFDATKKPPLERTVRWLPADCWIPKRNLSFELNGYVASQAVLMKLWPEHVKEIEQQLDITAAVIPANG